jgi:anti-sigma factor RsiW
MNVTREVILDLLPLYVGGEASHPTRELVEEYLKGDPELAERVREMRAGVMSGLPEPALRPEIEMQSLRRTRRELAWQRWLLGFGVSFTAVAFSTRFDSHGAQATRVRPLLFDFSYGAGVTLLVGLACLAAYHVLRRRHRISK